MRSGETDVFHFWIPTDAVFLFLLTCDLTETD